MNMTMKKLLFQPHLFDRKNQRGIAILLGVLIFAAIGIIGAISVALRGLSNLQTSFALVQSYQAMSMADACAEDALQQIRDSNPFTGTSTLSFVQGNCTYEVINTGGQNRTINASSSAGSLVRKARISITKITPNITVSPWQEVADF